VVVDVVVAVAVKVNDNDNDDKSAGERALSVSFRRGSFRA
jgi:hypothetical protein